MQSTVKSLKSHMSKGTVLVVVGPDYEDLELWYPKLRLEAAGFAAPIAGMGAPSYVGKHGYPCPTDGAIGDLGADKLAGIVIPGGWAPDKLRRQQGLLSLVRELNNKGKLVASICHGPWVLASAGILRGRRLTSTVGIRDDVVNAGGEWVDEAVVTDGNLVTSRVPKDLPLFGEAIVGWLEGDRAAGAIL
jgi:protease I